MSAAPAIAITATAGLLLVAAHRSAVASIEAGDDGLGGFGPGAFSLDAIQSSAETAFNLLTEQTADLDMSTQSANVSAFLKVIRQSEGTEGRGGYRACYGYGYAIRDLSEHPTISGEWPGVVLPDSMCANAGFGPGCRSTAAGAYQIIRPTWVRIRDRLGLADFSEDSQDAAATELIRARGALEDVRAGRFTAAVTKCRQEWASLPGNSARQGQRTIDTLVSWYSSAGGYLA